MRISDYGVLRYLERRLGIDVDAARREIAEAVETPRMREPRRSGAGPQVMADRGKHACREAVLRCSGLGSS